MKIFRWLAAGVLVILLVALVLSRTSRVRNAQSPRRPAASVPAQEKAAAAAPVPSPTLATRSAVSKENNIESKPAVGPFEDWARQFAGADESQRTALLARGEALAKARHAEMVQLIRSNPEQAMVQMLPYGLRKQLPEKILSLIEKPVNGRGQFRPVYYTPLPGRESEVPPTEYEVVINKTKYKAFTWGDRLKEPAHDAAYIWGASVRDNVANEDLLALPEKPARFLDADEVKDLLASGKLARDSFCGVSGRVAEHFLQFGDNYHGFCETAHAQRFNDMLSGAHGVIWASGGDSAPKHPADDLPPPNGSDTQGLKKLLYIRVLFADDPIPPQSDDGAQATAKANNKYFNDGSYGTVWWETTVTPLIRLPQRKNFYGENPFTLLSDAEAGAAALGYFSRDYFSPFYLLCNSLPQYKFGGLSSGILNGSPGAITHELGHNFGLPHANFWQPEGRQPGPVQPPNPQPPLPIDPDALIGHNDLNAPFILGLAKDEPSQEYGNPHDVMGSGPGHFSAMFWICQIPMTRHQISHTADFAPAHGVRLASQ